MKQNILQTLRQLGGARRASLWLTLALLLIGLALVALIPAYPIWALQLIGFPVTLSFKSYLGSAMLIVFYLWIRSLSQQPPTKPPHANL